MESTNKFSSGRCSFCGDKVQDEPVMERTWCGDSQQIHVFCDKTCEFAFAKQQASLKSEGQNIYTPYSSRPNIVHSFVIQADGDCVTVRDAIESAGQVAWPGRRGVVSIGADKFIVLYDYYLSDVHEQRGPGGYVEVADIRLSFPPRDFEEIIQLLKSCKQSDSDK